ncbi:MAG: hypothetical protein ACK50J_14805 [Planctomyces sp.]
MDNEDEFVMKVTESGVASALRGLPRQIHQPPSTNATRTYRHRGHSTLPGSCPLRTSVLDLVCSESPGAIEEKRSHCFDRRSRRSGRKTPTKNGGIVVVVQRAERLIRYGLAKSLTAPVDSAC